MTAAAIKGVFVELRTLASRSVARIVVEVPIEKANEALATLGGFPVPGEDRWVALALLDARVALVEKPAKAPAGREPRTWGNLTFAQQAGILCGNPDFIAWCGAADDHEAAEYIRRRCGVPSRAQLDRDPAAADVWRNLSRAFFTREDAASQEAAYRRTAP